MFSLLKLKHTKTLIVVKSTSLIKKKKDYLIKLDNGNDGLEYFFVNRLFSDERHTLIEIKKNIDTNSPKILIKDVNKGSSDQCENNETTGNEPINITNNDKCASNADTINQFHIQHEESNTIVNSYLDLDVKSDFHNDKLQSNVITNENLQSHTLDKTKSSKTYPRIIEDKKCKINMTILSKSSDTTANSSCNTSILGNLELSDVNLSDVNVSDMNGIDINNFENCGTNLNNNNGEEMIHEVLAENKSTFTSITENTELDSTIVPFCDLNGVKNSSINNDINNNDNKLYCSNSQIENVSQNTVEDEASENNLPKKILLKQKNVKKRAIENINNSDEECAPKKKRFTPPYGKTRRIRWTSEEKQTALLLFETNINNSTLPSLKEIISKTRKNILKNRQPAAIKTWIHNQFRNKI
ncbi:probable cyclin-dependent serine/threonine-protein kinase DDB_G0292550 [Nylanderia fulva]|uniref:probable cyclin-dependent serine/threonine-protein kinase DDB_G0292550 n=1 Tax=Nylanderia fulva TaxID=613905 RepID=UPI0010FAECCE|nr:probable cyclin-dependent serine/threonine-protein kinase DDB_G0292550 [Nylanderia fulva]